MRTLNKWKLISVLQFNRTVSAFNLSHLFKRQIVRIKATSTIAFNNDWYTAGYVQQRSMQGYQLLSEILPASRDTIFKLSPLTETYRLRIQRVAWLPDLRLEVYEDDALEESELPLVRCTDDSLPSFDGSDDSLPSFDGEP